MKIEAGSASEEKRKRRDTDAVIRDGEKLIRKKGGSGCHRRPRRRVEATSTAIQRLFVACKGAFKGPGTVPPPLDVQMLQLLLDQMKPEDFGLSRDLLFFRDTNSVKGTPRITCTIIYKCENFSMCIFFLPPTAVIPLHNHPGMTVFSKLLLGSMHIKSYDWVDPPKLDDSRPSSRSRLARLRADSDFTAPCNTSILYPTTGGNMHTFTAITPCAVLDVLGPPYSNEDGRDCTYYRDYPCSSSSDGDDDDDGGPYGWLEEIDVPKDLKMDAVPYLGPRIFDI